ncbi:MAG: glutamine synthetase family protein [Devosiaceae bacterium]|nr:glutamine synthetase family protein [Devosiaceae bacterium]
MTEINLQNWLDTHPELDSVRVVVCDLNGVLRGKRLPIEKLPKIFANEVRLPLSVVDVDIWGEDIAGSKLVFETGDADGIGMHTGRGILPVTWGEKPSAMVPVWLALEDGSSFCSDPRRALDFIVQKFSKLGLTPVVATELEFYLVDPANNRPIPPKSPVTGKRLNADGVLSLDELEHFDGFISDVFEACKLQNIPADAAISENGAGQFEINMMHVADPLRAADDAVFFKRLVRGIARKHGFGATFMAKPYAKRAGNGFHVHFSLLDKKGNNVFDDGTNKGSDVLQNAVAGLLHTMFDATLTFAPHQNSFRRLSPGSHAPTAIGWGYENRTTAIRIPGGPNIARRIEHRVAGADANPYLVLASILGGALIGIQQQLKPNQPVSGDAYSSDLAHLPADWVSAIEAFENSPLMGEIYSSQLRTLYTGCKKQELKKFLAHITDFEYDSYLETV